MTDATDTHVRQFRSALGAFATGVTIVTTRTGSGVDVGLTANSFNSLSLDPPMVLWSLAKSSRSLPAFLESGYFAVHVLAASQEALSHTFATRGAEKFAGLALERGRAGIPLLDGCTARFQCRTAIKYEGGDHLVFIGEVEAFDHFDRPPLVFHGGRYAAAVARPSAAPPLDAAEHHGTVTFGSADQLREAAALIPAELLLVETDGPFLAPAPNRGRSNAPAQVAHTVRAIAAVRQMDVAELCEVIWANGERVFGPWRT